MQNMIKLVISSIHSHPISLMKCDQLTMRFHTLFQSNRMYLNQIMMNERHDKLDTESVTNTNIFAAIAVNSFIDGHNPNAVPETLRLRQPLESRIG